MSIYISNLEQLTTLDCKFVTVNSLLLFVFQNLKEHLINIYSIYKRQLVNTTLFIDSYSLYFAVFGFLKMFVHVSLDKELKYSISLFSKFITN